MASLKIKVKEKKCPTGRTSSWEGTVDVPGLKSTKLARKDGVTTFPNRAALNSVARGLGKRLGMTVKYDEPTKTVAKKSACAKKSCKCSTPNTTTTPEAPCCSTTPTPPVTPSSLT